MSPRCTTRWALSIAMGGSCEDNVRRIYWRISVKTQARDTRRSGSSNSAFLRRFGGVVGYRICLTHRRPPVRARAESIFFRPHSVFPWPLGTDCIRENDVLSQDHPTSSSHSLSTPFVPNNRLGSWPCQFLRNFRRKFLLFRKDNDKQRTKASSGQSKVVVHTRRLQAKTVVLSTMAPSKSATAEGGQRQLASEGIRRWDFDAGDLIPLADTKRYLRGPTGRGR